MKMFRSRGGIGVRETSVALVAVCSILFSAIVVVAIRTANNDNPVVVVGATSNSTSTVPAEPAVIP
ncbi:MAG: hypothetical protein M3P34_06095, partial [Actinomycetota bacterium]|nr:hypothetical protein [Actinomycetota bacterium]